jgi:hypothetical protein
MPPCGQPLAADCSTVSLASVTVIFLLPSMEATCQQIVHSFPCHSAAYIITYRGAVKRPPQYLERLQMLFPCVRGFYCVCVCVCVWDDIVQCRFSGLSWLVGKLDSI